MGKTRLEEALIPITVSRRDQAVIVSPINTLKRRCPDLKWYEVHVSDKEGAERLFQGFMSDGVHRVVIADEFDELTAANAAGTAGGFVVQGVYDYINYGRERGLGMVLSSRRPQNIARDVTANADLVFIGQTIDPAALDYYQAWMVDTLHPEIDYRKVCRSLPPFVFLAWAPISGSPDEPGGACGLWTVDQNGDLRPWKADELYRDATSADDTEDGTTTDTESTDPDKGSGGSIVGSAGSASTTSSDPDTAKRIGETRKGNRIG
jgi:hypothetical protein